MTARKSTWFFGWLDGVLALVTEGHLTRTEAHVLIRLARHGDGATGDNCRPLITTLMRECALGLDGVRDALAKGRELGVIVLVKRGGGQGESARGTTYRMAPPSGWAVQLRGVEPTELEASGGDSGGNSAPNSAPNSGGNSGGSSPPPYQGYQGYQGYQRYPGYFLIL